MGEPAGGMRYCESRAIWHSLALYNFTLYTVHLYTLELCTVQLYTVQLYTVQVYTVQLYTVQYILYSVHREILVGMVIRVTPGH